MKHFLRCLSGLLLLTAACSQTSPPVPLQQTTTQEEITILPTNPPIPDPTKYEPTPTFEPTAQQPQAAGNLTAKITSPEQMTRLTNTPGDEYHTVWSPDGAWLLFTYQSDGQFNLGTYHFPTASWQLINADLEGDLYTGWGPNSDQIIYDAYDKQGRSSIYIAEFPTDLSLPLQTTKTDIPSPAFMPSISPDGSQILFFYDNYINLFDINHGKITPLADTQGCWHPKFSPDGTEILFTKMEGDHQDIYAYHLEQGTTTKLTASEGISDRASWAPDGKHIVYVNTVDGVNQILITNASNLQTFTLVHLSEEKYGQVSMPVFSPDGNSIVITYQGDLWILDVNP